MMSMDTTANCVAQEVALIIMRHAREQGVRWTGSERMSFPFAVVSYLTAGFTASLVEDQTAVSGQEIIEALMAHCLELVEQMQSTAPEDKRWLRLYDA